MLDRLFQRSHHVRRLRANPLGAILDQFADHLLRPGYSAGFVHQLVRGAEHYGYYLGTRHPVVTTDLVSRASARQFLNEHLGTCSCPASFPRSLNPCRAAVRHLLRMLDQRDPDRLRPPATPVGSLLAEYDSFLRQTCGFSEHTCIYRLRNARDFLERHFGENLPDPGRLRPADLQDYFRRHAGHLSPGSVAVLASSLRNFLRFLALSHGFDSSLVGFIPAAPQWPRDRLPRSLSDEDLRAILNHFDICRATGRRDLAMIRCMSDLGLRVSEVADLTLDDIDWRCGVVAIRNGKGRRGRTLPLPAPLGRAITAYLKSGRPPVTDRHLFLRHTVPVGAPVTHTLIRSVFRQAYTAATGKTDSIGTHVLRHTAAARMRASGHGLKSIADVLGHRSVDTTAIYVKLDVDALRSVALPWPGGGL
jgi:site-specific recombinase XerD